MSDNPFVEKHVVQEGKLAYQVDFHEPVKVVISPFLFFFAEYSWRFSQ